MVTKKVDWEAVEIDYRVGIMTLRAIGEAHGISHVAVQKRAKAEGWTRNLSAKIKAKAEGLVTKAAVTTRVTKATEKQLVDAGAKLHASILLTHRKEIAESRAIVRKLLLELRRATKKQHDLPSRAVIAQRLVNAQAVLIEKERQAYGVGGNNDETKQTLPEWLEAA